MVISIVGHSIELDALFTSIANKKKVDVKGYKKIGGERIKETELSVIEIDDQNENIKLEYRGQIFNLDLENEDQDN